jgi:hypothetical protein
MMRGNADRIAGHQFGFAGYGINRQSSGTAAISTPSRRICTESRRWPASIVFMKK